MFKTKKEVTNSGGCCWGLFAEKATKDEVDFAFRRIAALENQLTKMAKNQHQPANAKNTVDYSVKLSPRKCRRKQICAEKGPKSESGTSSSNWKSESDKKADKGVMLIKLPCGCVLKRKCESCEVQQDVPLKSPGSSKFPKMKYANRVCDDKYRGDVLLPGDFVEENENELIFKNKAPDPSSSQDIKDPCLRSLSTCGCGFEECKRNRFEAGSNLSSNETSVERGTSAANLDTVQNDQISRYDSSVGTSCSEDCDNQSVVEIGKKPGYGLHCLPLPMAACGKYRKFKRAQPRKCNPLRYKMSNSNLNRLSKGHPNESCFRVTVLSPKPEKKKAKNKRQAAPSLNIKDHETSRSQTPNVHCPKCPCYNEVKNDNLFKKLINNKSIMKSKNNKQMSPTDISSCSSSSVDCQEISETEAQKQKMNSNNLSKVLQNSTTSSIKKYKKCDPKPICLDQSRDENNVVHPNSQNLDCDEDVSKSPDPRSLKTPKKSKTPSV